MNLSDIKPGPLIPNPEKDLPKLLGHFLTLVQFVPNIRHALGWRGLAPCERFPNTWTARIGDLPGIYGVYPDDVESKKSGWAQASFRIAYFPAPDEPMLRRFSHTARAYAAHPGYAEFIREFVADLDMAAAFEVGTFQFAANSDGTGLILGLSGLSRRRVKVDSSGTFDEHAPIFTLAFQLFKVLAASIAYVVGEAPSRLIRNTHTGFSYLKTADGSWCENIDESLNFNVLRLGFCGNTTELPIFKDLTPTPVKQSTAWCAPEPRPALYEDALWWQAHDLETLSVIDKRSLGIEDRPQLYVLSGFLGSGKTSFLQNFIEYQVQHQRFVAVIQNEIGKVSVDAKLLDQAYAITELNEGTVCCSLAGDLRPAIRKILSNFHPDIIVIETSGVANPLGLQADVRALEDLVRFDSVTTVIDAEQIERCLKEFDVTADQIRAADVLVLNKIDLVTNDELTRTEETLRTINPRAAMTRAHNGSVNPGLLYDFSLTAGEDTTESPHENQNGVPFHTHDRVSSLKVECPARLQTRQLTTFLENIPPNVFRIKGVVEVVGRGPTLVQFVGGRFSLSEFQNPKATERFLVLIGHELDPTVHSFRSLESTPAFCDSDRELAEGSPNPATMSEALNA